MDDEAREKIAFCRTCYRNYLAAVRLDECKATPLKSLVASDAGWGLFANASLPEKFFIPYGGEIVHRHVDTFLFTPATGAKLAAIANNGERARILAEMLRSGKVQRRNTSHFRVLTGHHSQLDGSCAPGPLSRHSLKRPDWYIYGVAQFCNHADEDNSAELIGRTNKATDHLIEEQGACTLRPIQSGEEITVFYCRHYNFQEADGPELSFCLMNIHPVRRITHLVKERRRSNVRKRTRAEQEAEVMINKIHEASMRLPKSLGGDACSD